MNDANAADADIMRARDAVKKLQELLHCGDKRVELSAAKEILSAAERRHADDAQADALSVTIRVVE